MTVQQLAAAAKVSRAAFEELGYQLGLDDVELGRFTATQRESTAETKKSADEIRRRVDDFQKDFFGVTKKFEDAAQNAAEAIQREIDGVAASLDGSKLANEADVYLAALHDIGGVQKLNNDQVQAGIKLLDDTISAAKRMKRDVPDAWYLVDLQLKETLGDISNIKNVMSVLPTMPLQNPDLPTLQAQWKNLDELAQSMPARLRQVGAALGALPGPPKKAWTEFVGYLGWRLIASRRL